METPETPDNTIAVGYAVIQQKGDGKGGKTWILYPNSRVYTNKTVAKEAAENVTKVYPDGIFSYIPMYIKIDDLALLNTKT